MTNIIIDRKKNMKKSKKIIFTLLALVVLTMSIPALASTIPNAGTERSFDTELPLSNKNVYFRTRTKQSNYAIGYAYTTSKSSSCNGINSWICDSSKSRCTSIAYCSSNNTKYAMNYSRNAASGSSVRLGMEDYDTTVLVNHSVKGYVNYN
jgi:hypothetical protein